MRGGIRTSDLFENTYILAVEIENIVDFQPLLWYN